MGLFDFFKSKNKGIADATFNSVQFQNEICAFALWKLKENNLDPTAAKHELRKQGLNDEQIHFILEKAVKLVDNAPANHNIQSPEIDQSRFNSEEYQNEIIDYAQGIYFKNKHNLEAVKEELFKAGLSLQQVSEIVAKVQRRNAEMVTDFEQQLDSGEISGIKIYPNQEHTKGNVEDDQVDRYIAYGAFQMERGDLDNALELFDKAIELDEHAVLAYANKGQLFSLKEDYEQALFFTNKALELEPNHKEILDNKVDLLFNLLKAGKLTESEFIENIQDVLEKDSESPNALIYIIQYHLKNNQLDGALHSLKNLFSNYYSDPQVINIMLDVFGKLPEEEGLIQFNRFENEIQQEAKYQLSYNKGLYLKDLKRYDQAIELYDNLNKLHEFSWNYYQMGIMKNLQGKTDESIELLKTTFRLEPGLKEDAKRFHELENLWSNPRFIVITS